jgi:hypothetical protein
MVFYDDIAHPRCEPQSVRCCQLEQEARQRTLQYPGDQSCWLGGAANITPTSGGPTLPFFILDNNAPLYLIGPFQEDEMSEVQGNRGLWGMQASLVIPQLDVDVDSKNDSGFATPTNNDDEDRLELDDSTGKIVFASTRFVTPQPANRLP